jgi:hypothetical protein
MAKKNRCSAQRDVPLEDFKQEPIPKMKELTPLLEEIAKATFSKVGHFAYPTFEQWEVGLMRDMQPWREILIWENIVRTFDLYVTKHGETTNREQVVGILASISTGQISENETENEIELRKLYRAAFVRQWIPLFGEPAKFPPKHALVLQYRDIVDEWDGGIYPNLRGKDDCRRILADADIVLGMATMSGEHFCIYGRDCLEGERLPKGRKTVIVRLDPENLKTHELEKICFVVERIKGRHDCE